MIGEQAIKGAEIEMRLKFGYPELCPYGSKNDRLHKDKMCPRCNGFKETVAQGSNNQSGESKDE